MRSPGREAGSPIQALEAALLVRADYDNKLDVWDRLKGNGRCFTIARHKGVLVGIARGTTDGAGWRTNLSFFHKPWKGVGETGDEWHRGWLDEAQKAVGFFRGKGLALLLGHSKGAATVQIASLSLGIDAITFAAPAPLWRRVSRAAPVVVNHCRTDDLVCRLPPEWLGYRRVGRTIWYEPKRRHWGEDHRIDHYIAVLDGSEPCETVEEGTAA